MRPPMMRPPIKSVFGLLRKILAPQLSSEGKSHTFGSCQVHHSRTELQAPAVGGSRRGGHVHQGGHRGEIDGRVQHDHVRAATVLNRPVADGAVATVTCAVGDKPREYVL